MKFYLHLWKLFSLEQFFLILPQNNVHRDSHYIRGKDRHDSSKRDWMSPYERIHTNAIFSILLSSFLSFYFLLLLNVSSTVMCSEHQQIPNNCIASFWSKSSLKKGGKKGDWCFRRGNKSKQFTPTDKSKLQLQRQSTSSINPSIIKLTWSKLKRRKINLVSYRPFCCITYWCFLSHSRDIIIHLSWMTFLARIQYMYACIECGALFLFYHMLYLLAVLQQWQEKFGYYWLPSAHFDKDTMGDDVQ